MIRLLELGTGVKSLLEVVMSEMRLISLDESEDLLLVDEVSAPINDSVGDLPDEYNKSGRSVVILGVSPDEQDGVHNRHEQVCNILEL
jgi:hypothetical protein